MGKLRKTWSPELKEQIVLAILRGEQMFRQEVRLITELHVQCAQFQHWYSTERLHSALGYAWDKLGASAKCLFAA